MLWMLERMVRHLSFLICCLSFSYASYAEEITPPKMLMLGEQLEFNHFATKEIPKYPITKVEGELEDILVGLQNLSERYKVEKKMEVHFRIVRFLNSYEIGNLCLSLFWRFWSPHIRLCRLKSFLRPSPAVQKNGRQQFRGLKMIMIKLNFPTFLSISPFWISRFLGLACVFRAGEPTSATVDIWEKVMKVN